MGRKIALELLMLCENITPQRAYELGLVNRGAERPATRDGHGDSGDGAAISSRRFWRRRMPTRSNSSIRTNSTSRANPITPFPSARVRISASVFSSPEQGLRSPSNASSCASRIFAWPWASSRWCGASASAYARWCNYLLNLRETNAGHACPILEIRHAEAALSLPGQGSGKRQQYILGFLR